MRPAEFRFWSPTLGVDAARISMVGAQNQEYFAIIEADVPGSVYRWRRSVTRAIIEDAIRRQCPPGNVAPYAREIQAQFPAGVFEVGGEFGPEPVVPQRRYPAQAGRSLMAKVAIGPLDWMATL